MKRIINLLVAILLLTMISGCSAKVELTQEEALLYEGQSFDPSLYITEETLKNEDLEISNFVNANVSGEYEVKYKINNSEKILHVNVKNDPVTLTDSEVTIETGTEINLENYIEQNDRSNNIVITSNLDTSNPGKYNVVYSFDTVSKELILNVENLEFELLKSNVEMELGKSLNLYNFFKSNFPNSENILVTNNADTMKVGAYKVEFIIKGNPYVLNVKVNDASPILTKTSVSIGYGSTFDPKNYLVENDRSNDQIKIDNLVNSSVAGTYVVTYSLGHIMKTLNVTVKEKVVVKKTPIQVNSLTSPVSAGSNATIEIKGTPNTVYSITVYYKSGASSADGLYSKTSDSEGNVSWTWKVGARTSSGSWKISIRSSVDSIDKYFTVN